jgi:starvation-inducible DNA-binding protein
MHAQETVRRTVTREREVSSSRPAAFTVPGLSGSDSEELIAALGDRLTSLLDLTLTLKHIHWNVVGTSFVAVHEMLDEHHRGVSAMADALAERIATLGGVPSGLPGRLVAQRTWVDYGLDRADAMTHMGALDLVFRGIISDHRRALERAAGIDPVTEDLLIQQTAALEKYQWFVRAHLADWAGGVANAGADTELDAARAVAAKRSRNAPRHADTSTRSES